MNIQGIGSLHISKDDPEAVKKVAKEMESIFINDLLKAMRKTVDSPESHFNAYNSIMDMELAREMSKRGLGLDKILEKQLDKMLLSEVKENGIEIKKLEDVGKIEIKDLSSTAALRALDNYKQLKNLDRPSDKRVDNTLGGGKK